MVVVIKIKISQKDYEEAVIVSWVRQLISKFEYRLTLWQIMNEEKLSSLSTFLTYCFVLS